MRLLLLIVLLVLYPGQTVISQDPIKVGLLIQHRHEIAAVQGAELAVKQINETGGIAGRPVLLFTRSMEGPWGTGSKQAVELIWEEGVCMLLGSHDGRNAHLVEQASAKSIVPFMSAWSSDPTLSQAFIPWFFNCVPNDEQQAEALIQEIFITRKYDNVLIVTDNEYDSNQALKAFMKYAGIRGIKVPRVLNYSEYENISEKFLSSIRSADPDCIIMLASPKSAFYTQELLNKAGISIPFYGTFLSLNENKLTTRQYDALKGRIILPDAGWSEIKKERFEKMFLANYGSEPGLVAIFAYDAMNALIEGISNAGSTENEKIQQALTKLKFEGVTGTIMFENLGIRHNSCFFKKPIK